MDKSRPKGRHRRQRAPRALHLNASAAVIGSAALLAAPAAPAIAAVRAPAPPISVETDGNGPFMSLPASTVRLYSQAVARLRQGVDSQTPAPSAFVLTAAVQAAPGTTLFEIPGALTISLNSDDDITVAITEEFRDEITAGLEGGESVAELVASVIPDSEDTASAIAAAEITEAALGIAASAWEGVTALCTSQATGDVVFTVGPTELACGDFVLTFA